MRCSRLVAWLAILVLSGCYPQTTTGPADTTARPVGVVQLHNEPVVETFSLIGSIEPWQEAVLYFEVSGIVAEVFVEEGDLVEAGVPIARLVLDDYELALSRSKAELDAVQARLDLLYAGTRKEDLEAAQADYARGNARAAYWDSELRRVAKLFSDGAISASQLEQVRRERDAADQERRSTKARLDRAVAGPRREEIKAAEAQVKARTEAAALANRNLQKATLQAPFRGRVEKRLLDAGAYVNVFPAGGVPVVHLVDLERVDAAIAVPEAFLPRFADKTQVAIVSAVNPQIRAQAEIVSLGQVADRASGTYELRARTSNPDGRFTGGMVVTAEVTGQAPRRAILIPVTALCRSYGQPPHVLLVEPKSSQVIAREVELGPFAGDRVEVVGGLAEGELLIVRGQDRVVAGDQVKYQPDVPTSVARTERPVP